MVVCIMIDVCNKDLRAPLYISMKRIVKLKPRNEICNDVERERTVVNELFAAMDVDVIAEADVRQGP